MTAFKNHDTRDRDHCGLTEGRLSMADCFTCAPLLSLSLDQAFQHIESGGLEAVAQQELLGARELLNRWNQPHQELEMSFDSRPGPACVVEHPVPQNIPT